MNVRKWIVAAAMLLAVVAVGAYKLSSAVRTRVAAATGQWTEEARRQNPQGYFDHVEQRLAEELEKLEQDGGRVGHGGDEAAVVGLARTEP